MNRTTAIVLSFLSIFFFCAVCSGGMGLAYMYGSGWGPFDNGNSQPTQVSEVVQPTQPVVTENDSEPIPAPIEMSVVEPPEVSDNSDGGAMEVEANSGMPGFSINGVPDKAQNVLMAECPDPYGNCFKYEIGLGSESWLAEPGVILYGPDEDPNIVKNNPHGDYFNPITQFMFTDPEREYGNVAEGAFLWFTGGQTHAEVGDVKITLQGAEGHNWFLVIRGLFEDGTQDADRNSTVAFSDYIPGHAQAMRHPAGAFISEEQFLQTAELSHTGGTNCGNEGCSGLSVMFVDLNTGAWLVLYQPQLNAAWERIDGNW